MPVTLSDIQTARQRLGNAIYHSPCPYSLLLSRLCGCRVFCKLDHLQITGSFKERGARNKLLTLDPTQRRRGVIAASAGNHALGVACHAQALAIPATVVMPVGASLVKIENCRSFGAQIVFHGQTVEEAYAHAHELADRRSLLFVHGFDDPDIIAGQGTLALEILQDVPNADVIIVPVGGGGLIAGVAVAAKALRPAVQIIGAEPRQAPTLHASLEAGRPTRVQTGPTLADGLAVAQVGDLCFHTVAPLIDRTILVDEPQIALAILRLLELEKMVVEGAGAVPLAAALACAADLKDKTVVLLLTGGNIDVTLLARIIERGLAAEGRLCRVTARLNDSPGSLARLTAVFAAAGASVKEVAHDRNFGPADIASVGVSCILETRSFDHIQEIRRALAAAGIDASVT